jgi:hypothetical protein
MGKLRNAYSILVGKPERKRPSGRLGRRWTYNIRMNLRKCVCEGVDWIHLAEDKDQW